MQDNTSYPARSSHKRDACWGKGILRTFQEQELRGLQEISQRMFYKHQEILSVGVPDILNICPTPGHLTMKKESADRSVLGRRRRKALNWRRDSSFGL